MTSEKEKSIYWANQDTDSVERIESVLKRIKEMDIGSIVFRKITPNLPDLVHSFGIRAYADFPCFEGQDYWWQYPEARPVDSLGTPLLNEEWYYGVNPAVEPIRRNLLEKFEELVRTDGIDGIWLDFIRWPCHWEVYQPKLIQTSFDEYTIRRFLSEAGLERPNGDIKSWILGTQFNVWSRWKSSIITSWVKSAWEIRNRIVPGITLGMFGVPWLKDEYYGAIISIIGQDYSSLSQYIDVFSPMTYHLMCNKPISWIIDSMKGIKTATGKKVMPIIQCADLPKELELGEYVDAIKGALEDNDSSGVMIFELEHLLKSNKLNVTKKYLKYF